MDELLRTASSILTMIGTAGSIGSLGFRIGVLPMALEGLEPKMSARLRGRSDRLVATALAALALGTMLELISRSAEMSGRITYAVVLAPVGSGDPRMRVTAISASALPLSNIARAATLATLAVGLGVLNRYAPVAPAAMDPGRRVPERQCPPMEGLAYDRGLDSQECVARSFTRRISVEALLRLAILGLQELPAQRTPAPDRGAEQERACRTSTPTG
ncbi:MAG: hypothetical protein ACE5IL_11980 [Myxococcota bacterium]